MDNFNSVSSRGYCAGDYYNYSPNVNIYINYYFAYYATCDQYYTFAAYTGGTAVNTNVSIDIYWYGDLGGLMSGTVTIYSGTTCNTTSVYSGGGINCWGENISFSSVNIYPVGYGSQTYLGGTQYPIGYSPC